MHKLGYDVWLFSALEVIFNVMHSTNPRFTYLLTYLQAMYNVHAMYNAKDHMYTSAKHLFYLNMPYTTQRNNKVHSLQKHVTWQL